MEKRSMFSVYIVYAVLIAISWSFLTILFQLKFGTTLHKLPLQDDFLETYTMSIKGIEMLKEGGVFGWDIRHLGGYPVVYTGTTMISFIMLPFYMVFGEGCYLPMLLSLCFLFPLGMSLYVQILFKNHKATLLSIIFATSVFLLYFKTVLNVGNIHSYAGVVVFIFCLIFYEGIRRGIKFAFAGCVFSLALLYYTYFPYAFFFLALISFDWIFKPSKAAFYRVMTIGIFLFLMSLHYNWYYLFHSDYLAYGVIDYEPVIQWDSLAGAKERLLSPLRIVIAHRYAYYFFAISPVFFLGLFTKKIRRQSLMFLSLACLYIFSMGYFNAQYYYFYYLLPVLPVFVLGLFFKKIRAPSLIILSLSGLCIFAEVFYISYYAYGVLPGRVIMLVPIFVTTVFAYSAAARGSRFFRILPWFFFIVPLCSGYSYINRKGSFKAIASVREYYPGLSDYLKGLDGHMILFENSNGRNLSRNKKDPRIRTELKHVHIANYMAMEIDRNFFSTTHDGWHETIYRGNCIHRGVFRGDLILDVELETVEAVLKKWGIKYLAVWSPHTQEYLNRYTEKFRRVWKRDEWEVFEYQDADTRTMVLEKGEGAIISETYFSKTITLTDVREGDLLVLRSNYFPTWRAFYQEEELHLQNVKGQMGMILPAEGSYQITLKFPKYEIFSIIALLTLGLAGLLSVSRPFRELIRAKNEDVSEQIEE